MYQNVSEDFKAVISSHSRTFRAKLVFDDFQITDGIYSIKLNGGSVTSDELTIGSALAATAQIELEKQSVSLKNKSFELWLGLKLNDDSIEYIPMGVYHIRNAATRDRITKLEVADSMYLADKEYKTSTIFPTTADVVVGEICRALKVSHSIEGLENIVIPTAPTASAMREILGLIAALQGKNAMFDRTGKLVFKWYENSDWTTNTDYIDEPDIEEDDFTVEYLRCVITDKITSVAGDENSVNGISISDKWATTELVQSIYQQIGGFSYRPCKVDMILGDPRIDPWDIIHINTGDEQIDTIGMNLDFDFDGGLSCTLTAPGPDTDKEYLTPKQIAEKKTAETNRNNTLVVTSTNAKAVTVGQTEQKLLSLDFSTQSESIPYINATIQLEETASSVVTVLLKLNGSTHSAYRISADEGYNLMSFSTAFLELMGGSHQLELIISGGNAKIMPSGANIILTGYGLVAQAAWNGFVTLSDIVNDAVVYAKKISIQNVSEMIDIVTISPIAKALSEQISDVVVVTSDVECQTVSDKLPHNIFSVSNSANDIIEIMLSNPVYLDSIGNIDPSAFTLQGFVGATPTAITVYEAGLEEPGAPNLIDVTSWDKSDDKLISALVAVDTDKSYYFTLINCNIPFTKDILDRYTENQLDNIREIELEGKQYQATLLFYNAENELLSSYEMSKGVITMPDDCVSIRVQISSDRELSEDDLICFYAKVEEGDRSTVYRFSNKIVLKVDDLSQFESSIIYSIGDVGAIDPFTNQTIDLASSSSFERVIY